MHDLAPEIAGLLVNGKGVFTVADADAAGVGKGRLERLVRTGVLERVGRGVFASSGQLARANPWVAHSIRTRGFVRACRTPSFAAGWSAVAVRELPTLGAPPATPSVIQPSAVATGSGLGSDRRAGGATRTRYGHVRSSQLPPEHLRHHGGCPIVGNAWMVADLARYAPRADAMVVADAVLAGGTTASAITRVLATMSHWPGIDAARWVLEHADGRAESALETLGRLSCIEYGVALPQCNVWVGPGFPLFRVDFLWPWHWVVAEADGATKYRNALDAARVVADEKERQWRLERELSLDVVRYGWSIAAYHRDQLAERFATVLTANPVREAPIQWWPTSNPFIGPDGQMLA